MKETMIETLEMFSLECGRMIVKQIRPGARKHPVSCFGGPMAKNTGKNFRKGSVDDRTQLDLDADPKKEKFVKRDTNTGRFTDLKEDDKPFKGVAQEPDERRE